MVRGPSGTLNFIRQLNDPLPFLANLDGFMRSREKTRAITAKRGRGGQVETGKEREGEKKRGRSKTENDKETPTEKDTVKYLVVLNTGL